MKGVLVPSPTPASPASQRRRATTTRSVGMLVMIGDFIALVMGRAVSVSASASALLVKRLIQDQTQDQTHRHVDTAQTTWTT